MCSPKDGRFHILHLPGTFIIYVIGTFGKKWHKLQDFLFCFCQVLIFDWFIWQKLRKIARLHILHLPGTFIIYTIVFLAKKNWHKLLDFLFCICQVLIFDWYIWQKLRKIARFHILRSPASLNFSPFSLISISIKSSPLHTD